MGRIRPNESNKPTPPLKPALNLSLPKDALPEVTDSAPKFSLLDELRVTNRPQSEDELRVEALRKLKAALATTAPEPGPEVVSERPEQEIPGLEAPDETQRPHSEADDSQDAVHRVFTALAMAQTSQTPKGAGLVADPNRFQVTTKSEGTAYEHGAQVAMDQGLTVAIKEQGTRSIDPTSFAERLNPVQDTRNRTLDAKLAAGRGQFTLASSENVAAGVRTANTEVNYKEDGLGFAVRSQESKPGEGPTTRGTEETVTIGGTERSLAVAHSQQVDASHQKTTKVKADVTAGTFNLGVTNARSVTESGEGSQSTELVSGFTLGSGKMLLTTTQESNAATSAQRGRVSYGSDGFSVEVGQSHTGFTDGTTSTNVADAKVGLKVGEAQYTVTGNQEENAALRQLNTRVSYEEGKYKLDVGAAHSAPIASGSSSTGVDATMGMPFKEGTLTIQASRTNGEQQSTNARATYATETLTVEVGETQSSSQTSDSRSRGIDGKVSFPYEAGKLTLQAGHAVNAGEKITLGAQFEQNGRSLGARATLANNPADESIATVSINTDELKLGDHKFSGQLELGGQRPGNENWKPYASGTILVDAAGGGKGFLKFDPSGASGSKAYVGYQMDF